MYYKEELVEEVRERNDIVDVISSYIRIQKRGNNYVGLCPFHNEKTPSFVVSGGKQLYTCFGCGASGNVIGFVMKYENYSFQEALQSLAARVGMELPESDYDKEEKKNRDIKQRLLEIHKEAAKFYYHSLLKDETAKNYLYKRGISDATIRQFGLGYSPKAPDSLYKYLKKTYDDDILKLSGLVIMEERGAKDRFWNRIMYPILDIHSKVIGFGGRVMGDALPKYINSSESMIFDKSRQLYGLNFAKSSRQNFVLLCEGYMDVISLYQAGFNNAVAALGTAFTPNHANILKRYVKRVVLSMDSDNAGINASKKTIGILREAGIAVLVLNMKPYKDPDEFIKNTSKEEFEKRIKNAKNAFMWEIELLKQQFKMEDPEQKTEFYKETAKKLAEFNVALERDNYIQAVCNEHIINYEEMKALVLSIMGGVSIKREKQAFYNSGRKKKEDPVLKCQRLLLIIMIEDDSYIEKIRKYLSPDDFSNELYKEILLKIYEKSALNMPLESIIDEYADTENYDNISGLFTASLSDEINLSEKRKIAEENILKLRQARLDELSKHSTDIVQLQKIIHEQSKLKKEGISID